jgi:hypothetical protein
VAGEVLRLAVTFRAELPEPPKVSVTLDGSRLPVGPVGEIVAASPTIPENPLTLESAIVEVLEVPWMIVKEVGLAEITKSGDGCCVTETETTAKCVSEPATAVTFTT